MTKDFDPRIALRRLVEMAEAQHQEYTGCCPEPPAGDVSEATILYSMLSGLPPSELDASGITLAELSSADSAYTSITGKANRGLSSVQRRQSHPKVAAVQRVLQEADMIGSGFVSGVPYAPSVEVVEDLVRTLDGVGSELASLLPDGTTPGAFLGAYRLVTKKDL